jgi:pimeloyl-ACP methyl ester carboxylesterase
MSSFTITTHTIPAAHLREFPRGTISGPNGVQPALKLVVNQYVPTSYTPQAGDVSIIFGHANGFHKELYEPFFSDLLSHYPRIRGIWAVDAAHQGQSGILNEAVLGDQPCWNDYPRDILHVVNTFSSQLPAPLIGMGHSFGGHAVLRVALMHPGLFTALVEIDAVIEEYPHGNAPAKASARRRDCWPTREAAEDYFRSREFYKRWDPRCLELHLKHGLRDLPTATYPDKAGVTLATTKHQELYTFLRCVGPAGNEHVEQHSVPADTWRKLKEVVPPVLYIVGGDSDVSTPRANQRKMENTPTAEMESIPCVGHLVPMEKPTETGECSAFFVARVVGGMLTLAAGKAVIAAKYMQKQIRAWKAAAEEDQRTPRQKHLTASFVKEIAKL